MMNIRIDRAMLYINSETSGFETPTAGPLEAMLQINVYTGALSGLYAGMMVSLAAIAALSF